MKHLKITVGQESHEVPGWAVRMLTKAGGRNRFGDPNYRLAWGWNRLSHVGGKFEDGSIGLCLMPKYPCIDRWIIEQWLPPEAYGTMDSWYRQTKEWGDEGNVPQLGPYPSRGDYELACIIETPDTKEFVQITPSLIDEFFWQLKLARLRKYSEAVRWRKEQQAMRDRKSVDYGHEYLNEVSKPSFNDGMYVTVA